MTRRHSDENEQRELLHATLSSLTDGVVLTDRQGRISFLNPAVESWTGWRAAEALGKELDAVLRLVDAGTRQLVASPLAKALEEDRSVRLLRAALIAKDGTEREIDVSASPVRTPEGLSGGVLFLRDVAAEQHEQRHERERVEPFRLLVESVQDHAIFMLDAQGRVVTWNLGAQRIKGYVASEIIGSHFSRFYPKEAVDSGWPQQELAFAERDGRFEDEGWRVRKDGSQFWANVVITAIRDHAGALRGFAKVTRDLTQRRLLERSRAKAEVLADLDRRKNEFLAILSHELRNPLAPLRTAVQIFRLEPDDNPIRKDAVAVMDRQLKNLTRLVEDLLEVSRIETGKIHLQREHVELRGVVERSVDSVRSSADASRLAVSTSLPAEPVVVVGDHMRLEQVLVNLLTNAIKYSVKPGTIRIGLRVDGGEAVLSVQDEGIGIPADLLPRIFELFTQSDRSLDRSQGGLGVGLAIVRRLVEMHGGRVEAHSPGEGQGSTFVLRFPTAKTDSKERGDVPDAPGVESPRIRRILVVDDNRDAAEMLRVLAESMGHEARVAYSSEDAIVIAVSYRPEVILLDLGLPQTDGYELARLIRSRSDLGDPLLVAITGYGHTSDRERSKHAGISVHLVKPVDPRELHRILSAPAHERTE